MQNIRAISKLRLEGIRCFSTNRLYHHFDSRNAVKSWGYKGWRQIIVNHLLPDVFLPSDMTGYGLCIHVGIPFEFDLDNTLKSLIDALQEKYGFDDNQISYLKAKKVSSGSIDDNTYDPEQDFIEIILLENVEIDFTNCVNFESKTSIIELEKEERVRIADLMRVKGFLEDFGKNL